MTCLLSRKERDRRKEQVSHIRVVDTDTFAEKSAVVHGDRYDYSLVEYSGSKGKVTIICPDHGEFTQVAEAHHNGKGCPSCRSVGIGNAHRKTAKDLIDLAVNKHGDKYDYALIKSGVSSRDKVEIVCPIHGSFYKVMSTHIFGQGCPSCSRENTAWGGLLSYSEVIDRCNRRHNHSYTYLTPNEEYINISSKLKIYCHDHDGVFYQTAKNHMDGQTCRTCSYARRGYYSLGYLNHHEEQKTKPAVFYILRVSHQTEDFIKIGITVNISNRIRALNSQADYTFEPIFQHETTLEDAIRIESELSSIVLENRQKYEPLEKFFGYTECANEAALPSIEQYLEEHEHAITRR